MRAPRYTARGVRVAVLLFSAVIASRPHTAIAQDAPPSAWGRASDVGLAAARTDAAWLGAWSPLRGIADIARPGFRAPDAPGLMQAPAPRMGSFILAGAPGALAYDLRRSLGVDSARYSELTLHSAREQGTFRRPFDVADREVTQLGGQGWSPIGTRGMAIGRFILDREGSDVSGNSQRAMPYGSSPFIAADSVTPALQGTRARFEGALAFRVGPVSLGGSAGVDTREHNSIDAPLRRTGRATIPATSLGAQYTVPWAGGGVRDVRVGGYYRWSEASEQNILNPVPRATIVYAIQGLDEPLGIPANNGQAIFVRTERRSSAVGGSLDLQLFGAQVAVTYEEGQLAEDQYRALIGVRPTDRWRATGRDVRLGAQRSVLGARVTLVASSEQVNGDGQRYDLRGIALNGADERNAIELDVRRPVGTKWDVALTGGAVQQTRTLTDFVVPRTAELDGLMGFGSAEVGRVFSTRAIRRVVVGGAFASRAPDAVVPRADRNYQLLIAPGLRYDATTATATAGWVRLHVPVRTHTLIVGGRMDRTNAPATTSGSVGTSRDAWRVQVAWQ